MEHPYTRSRVAVIILQAAHSGEKPTPMEGRHGRLSGLNCSSVVRNGVQLLPVRGLI